VLKLILLIVPLGLDTFAVSAALGMRGLPAAARLRVSLVMSSFEVAMPIVGLLRPALGARLNAKETRRPRFERPD
jgi:putative Mn2+ efflux pump MntP